MNKTTLIFKGFTGDQRVLEVLGSDCTQRILHRFTLLWFGLNVYCGNRNLEDAILATPLSTRPVQGCIAEVRGPYINSTVSAFTVCAPVILMFLEQELNSAKELPV